MNADNGAPRSQGHDSGLENLLHEERRFEPPRDLAEHATVP